MATNMKQITIRPETHRDYKDIVSLVLRSFKVVYDMYYNA